MATVINADCRQWLSQPNNFDTFDFIFADPPFNIGQRYDGYSDDMPYVAYEQFTQEWVMLCWNKLKPGGAMVIHASWSLNYLIYEQLVKLGIWSFIEQEIIWAYNFGQCTFTQFINGHCKAIVMRKIGAERKFYPDSVLVESLRKRIGDKRIADSPYAGMVVPSTVWGFANESEPWQPDPFWGRVQGNNGERMPDHPNQLPELYLARFIKAYTESGDSVFDPFGGSGTTAVVAEALNRVCVTTEISTPYCESIKQRLAKGALRV